MTYTEFRQRYRWNAKVDKLGEGGFAKIYKAHDTHRDRFIVLKIADVPADHKFSLEREVDLNRDLTAHPNIAQYRNCYRFANEYGEEKDYATMDYFSAGSLSVVMANALSPDEIRDIVVGMLRGLIHLEQEKVIHRDFKPGNVLMDRDAKGAWIPKISDFGLSRFTSTEKTVSNSSVGISYDYAAPEQFLPGTVNRQADLWALGVIIYRLCTGKPAFVAQSDLTGESRRIELIRLINQAQLPADIDQIDEPYQTIIRRCLVKELSVRVKSANGLLDLVTKQAVQAELSDQLVATEQVTNLNHPPVQQISNISFAETANVVVNDSQRAARVETKPTSQQSRKKNTYSILVVAVILIGLIGSYYAWRYQKVKQANKPLDAVTLAAVGNSSIPEATLPVHTNPVSESPSVQHITSVETKINKIPIDKAVGKPIMTAQEQPKIGASDVKPADKEDPKPLEEKPVAVEQKNDPPVNTLVTAAAADPLPSTTKTNRVDAPSNPTNRTLRLSGGTEVLVALSQPVAAASATEGQRIALQVTKAISVNGEILIPQGADVLGEVANVSTGGKKDMLEIRIRSIKGVDGQTVEVRAATFRYVGSRNEPLVFKAGQQFVVYTAGAHKFNL